MGTLTRPSPRNTSDLMIVVATFALLLGIAIQWWGWCRLRRQYALADCAYQARKCWYSEGRLGLTDCVSASETLLRAEFALSTGQSERTAAINAHLRRATELLDFERRQPLSCNENRDASILQAEQLLEVWRVRMTSPTQ